MKKLHLLALVGIVSSIALGCYFDNGWFMLLFLASVAFGNIVREKEENILWNEGICAKYNEPWEFVETIIYTETTDVHYKCRDQHFFASPRDYFTKTRKS